MYLPGGIKNEKNNIDGDEYLNKSEMYLHSWQENYGQQRESVGERPKGESWNKAIPTNTCAIHNPEDLLYQEACA